MASPVDVNELFLKCMTESATEKLTARTVAAYITSPFEIYCNNFVSEAERDEITEYQKLLFQRGNDHENQTVHAKCPNCGRNAKNHQDTEKDFGFRNMDGIMRPQSWCKACRKKQIIPKTVVKYYLIHYY